jgi:hypothetical protein
LLDIAVEKKEAENGRRKSRMLIVARSFSLRSFSRQFMSWAPPDFILEAANEALANTMANHYS